MVTWMCNKRPLFGLPPGVGLPAPRTIGISPDEVSFIKLMRHLWGKPLGSLRRGVLAPVRRRWEPFQVLGGERAPEVESVTNKQRLNQL